MADKKRNNNQSLLNKLTTVPLGWPWPEVVREAWRILRKVIQGRSYPGMYEVLDYESTLELKDREGKKATFKKREKVRYLQDNALSAG